jgi:hypothetical protein
MGTRRGLLLLIIPHTFSLTTAHDAFACETPPLTDDHGALRFTSPIIVRQHDPIMRHAQLVCPRRIGKQCGVMLLTELGVPHRQPL